MNNIARIAIADNSSGACEFNSCGGVGECWATASRMCSSELPPKALRPASNSYSTVPSE